MEEPNSMIKNHILALVNRTISNKPDVRDTTAKILSTIFDNYNSTSEWVSILYRLIFHTSKQDPDMSCYILCGFIKFGQTEEGYKYKPMLDYFIIKAFDGIIDTCGWCMLKPCILSLTNSFDNLSSEPLFNYVLSKIVVQLRNDTNMYPYIYIASDICHHLPREKSFVWGWFSRNIANSYYSHNSFHKPAKKQMRIYLMYYRKTLTYFRKMIQRTEMETCIPSIIHEEWNDLVNTLNNDEYKWASNIISYYLPSNKSVYSIPFENEYGIPSMNNVLIPAEGEYEAECEVVYEAECEVVYEAEAEHEVASEAEHEVADEAEHEVASEAEHEVAVEAEHEVASEAEHEVAVEAEDEAECEVASEVVYEAEDEAEVEVIEIEDELIKSALMENKKIESSSWSNWFGWY